VFLDKVHKEREKELSISKKKAMCEAIGYFLYWLTCPMILIATFTTYLLLGNEMTSQAAFTTIMIFSILQYPIRQLPTSISEILQIATSLKRIEKFLLSKEINQKRIHLNELPYE
jgi:ABC-type bacteriocin/lantibiotic exporter with double-glycine peptidase domain